MVSVTWRKLVELGSSPCAVLDKEGRTIFGNAAYLAHEVPCEFQTAWQGALAQAVVQGEAHVFTASHHWSFAWDVDGGVVLVRGELHVSNALRMESILRYIPVMISVFTPDGRFVWANPCWERELGWSVEAMQGKDMLAEFYPDETVREDVRTFMTSATPGWREFHTRTRDGTRVHTRWANFRLSSGESIGIGENIDARKRLEMDMSTTNERLEYILEGASLGAWDWNLTTNEVVFDARWSRMIGLDPHTTPQVLSTWESRVHPEDLAQVYADIRDHLEGRKSAYENVHRMRHTDGHWVHILDRGRVSERAPDGTPLRFTGTHFDLSNHKRVEEELRTTRERLESAQAVAAMGSWEFDVETRTISWSRQMYSFFPQYEHQGPPSYESHLAGLNEEDARRLDACVRTAIDTGQPYLLRYRTTKDGRTLWLEGRGEALRGSDGRVVALRGTSQDITERVAAEEENARILAALEQTRMRTVQTAKMASLGLMAGGVAHEINNPLAILTGRTGELARLLESDDIDKERCLHAVESISRTTERIAKIVRGLKAFSRNADHDPPQAVALRVLVDDTLELCRARFRHHGIDLVVGDVPEASCSCRPSQVSQILMNLLSNAFDAVAGTPGARVQLDALAHDDGRVEFRVTDNGTGIPEDIVDRIMDPFFTTKAIGIGTGLGLSVSKGLAEDQGGRLWLDRSCPQTRFIVELPAAQGNRDARVHKATA